LESEIQCLIGLKLLNCKKYDSFHVSQRHQIIQTISSISRCHKSWSTWRITTITIAATVDTVGSRNSSWCVKAIITWRSISYTSRSVLFKSNCINGLKTNLLYQKNHWYQQNKNQSSLPLFLSLPFHF